MKPGGSSFHKHNLSWMKPAVLPFTHTNFLEWTPAVLPFTHTTFLEWTPAVPPFTKHILSWMRPGGSLRGLTYTDQKDSEASNTRNRRPLRKSKNRLLPRSSAHCGTSHTKRPPKSGRVQTENERKACQLWAHTRLLLLHAFFLFAFLSRAQRHRFRDDCNSSPATYLVCSTLPNLADFFFPTKSNTIE